MKSSSVNRRKVVVVGAGAVGATFAYSLAQSGLAEEIAIIDESGWPHSRAGHGFGPRSSHISLPVSIHVGNPSDYANARLIVITAGAAQHPGETRLQLLKQNAAVVRAVVAEVIDQRNHLQ